MAARKRTSAPRCKQAEIEIGGKCYKLFLVAARGPIVKGADCSFARTNIVVDVSSELGGFFAGKKSGNGPRSKKKK
jgi:hypothetical protein